MHFSYLQISPSLVPEVLVEQVAELGLGGVHRRPVVEVVDSLGREHDGEGDQHHHHVQAALPPPDGAADTGVYGRDQTLVLQRLRSIDRDGVRSLIISHVK